VLFLAKGYASAKAALEMGAAESLTQPLNSDQLQIAIMRLERWRRAQRLVAGAGTESAADTAWVGQSPAILQIKQTVRKLARTQATLLIQGEAGAGKTHVARQLHRQSPRAGGPFLTVDAAAADAQDIHHELFGRPGSAEPALVDLAHGGTLLIEDIDRLPLASQEALLGLIETRSFRREGSERPIHLDVRVLATSRADITSLVADGTFREDLSIALHLLPIRVPSLNERNGDIPLLAEHFLRRFAAKYGRPRVVLSREAWQALERHAWNGHVRELKALLGQAILRLDSGSVLEPAHLLVAVPSAHQAPREPEVDDLATLEKQHIFRVLKKCGDNRTHAARRLGCSIRTLRNKLREYRLAAEAEAKARGEAPSQARDEGAAPAGRDANPSAAKDTTRNTVREQTAPAVDIAA
jgi:two-component system response regulator FlrC